MLSSYTPIISSMRLRSAKTRMWGFGGSISNNNDQQQVLTWPKRITSRFRTVVICGWNGSMHVPFVKLRTSDWCNVDNTLSIGVDRYLPSDSASWVSKNDCISRLPLSRSLSGDSVIQQLHFGTQNDLLKLRCFQLCWLHFGFVYLCEGVSSFGNHPVCIANTH